ncbi:MAG: DUF423 domain-containing protein [Methylobacteriaceae bacterium]|nr:DUF423 domain-containing protein [Methylobacteriaceae bacterium]
MAAGTHAAGATATTAGQMLLFHAAALIAGTAARKAGLLRDGAARLALAAMALGVGLFAADLALRATAGARLFPMAAPLGGGLTIAGWLGLAGAALAARR